MDLETLRLSLAHADPPAGLAAPLQALWFAAKGDWHRAHHTVQSDESAAAAWVHAYLHRVEGDLSNARYWYQRAERGPATVTLDDEWSDIAMTLL